MKRAYVSVINDLATDQRVRRLIHLLVEQGFEVYCIGRSLRKSPGLHHSVFKIRRYRMLFKGGPLLYTCFNTRLLMTLLTARRPALLIANDLDTLPASFVASRIRRVPLIYDSHELFTQVPELINRKKVQSVWLWIEGLIVPRLRYAVTVNYSIATIYRRLYGTSFRVVRNVPVKLEYKKQEKRPEKSPGQKPVIIYQGALNVGRGLELMIDTMHYLEDALLVIVGTGDIEDELKQQVRQDMLGDRVEFRGRMLPEELEGLTLSADLGISLEEDLGLNYRYALPNKIFDYIRCHVPVLCSELPEMSRIVNSYGVGIATAEKDPEKLAGIIRYMLKERSAGAWKEALQQASLDLCWEKESNVYLELLNDCGLMN